MHAALVVGAELGPDDVVVVLLPDSGRNYLSKIFDDDWMTGSASSAQRRAPPPATCSRRRTSSIPDLVVITADTPRATRVARMRELGVSQLVVAITDRAAARGEGGVGHGVGAAR